MASRKQVNYALFLMRKLGIGTEWMSSEHKALGATMRERSGKVESWVSGMNSARASALIDDLLRRQKRRETPEKASPVAAIAEAGKEAKEKSAKAVKAVAPAAPSQRKEPRGKTARAVAGLPPLKSKRAGSTKPLSRRSTLGTLCERVR